MGRSSSINDNLQSSSRRRMGQNFWPRSSYYDNGKPVITDRQNEQLQGPNYSSSRSSLKIQLAFSIKWPKEMHPGNIHANYKTTTMQFHSSNLQFTLSAKLGTKFDGCPAVITLQLRATLNHHVAKCIWKYTQCIENRGVIPLLLLTGCSCHDIFETKTARMMMSAAAAAITIITRCCCCCPLRCYP